MSDLSTVVGKSIDDFPIQVPEFDDTERIKRAFNFGVNAQLRTLIVFPNTIRYKISNKLTMDVNYTAIAGQGFLTVLAWQALLILTYLIQMFMDLEKAFNITIMHILSPCLTPIFIGAGPLLKCHQV